MQVGAKLWPHPKSPTLVMTVDLLKLRYVHLRHIGWKKSAIVNLPRRQTRPQECLLPMSEPATTSIPSVVFPLSSDHLIVLVQYNVLRGSHMNRQLLDHTLKVAFNKPSTTISTNTHVFPRLTAHAFHTLPLTLRPTQLQSTVSLPHWVDIIPHPRMRDNLINAMGGFDAEVLWVETVGGLFLGFAADAGAEAKGAMVWDTPSWCGTRRGVGKVGS
jgi:hypothetical protein